jgi:acetyl esterase/lipase
MQSKTQNSKKTDHGFYRMKNNDTPDFRAIQTNPAIGDRGLIHVYGSDPSSPKPYILAIHGGGWRNGDQTSFAWIWPRVQELGFALVLPSHRLTPEFRFPHAYDDLVHVLAWLRDHGSSEGLDPGRCMLFGSSAGGHWSMLLATRAMKENLPMPRIRGVVNYCGVMDMPSQYAFDIERKTTMVNDFMGATPESDPALYRSASPIYHIHDSMPPVWMAHGTTDGAVPIAQSRDMVHALKAAGNDPIYLEARSLGHTMIEITPDGKILKPQKLLFEEDLLRFIGRHLFM